MNAPHTPVMLREVLDAISPRDGAIYVDATFGAGGYSRGLLDTAKCKVFAMDRDPWAVRRGRDMETRYQDRLKVLKGCFGDMTRLLGGVGVDKVDGVAMDLGVSSMQVDEAERGFSFRADGPLDMRMEADTGDMTAADVVNGCEEKELADIIYTYGGERASRRVAKAIVEARAREPFTRTAQLAHVVRGAVRKSKDGIDPATRTFQALRIYVNDELGELDRGLLAAETLLRPGGRLAVVSFHSLEDSRVKDFLRRCSGVRPGTSRHLPEPPGSNEKPQPPSFRLIGRGAQKPSADEIAANPRARSARLRTAERTDAPVFHGGRQAA